MSTRRINPVTPASRFQTYSGFDEITKSRPEKKLLVPLKKSGGRNNYGRKTSRHRGGGHKRRYRLIDFKRDKVSVSAKVYSIEYDPNRSARIALLHYVDGEKRYIVCPLKTKVGDILISGSSIDIKPGNSLRIKDIPVGEVVHNIELSPGGGAKLVRSAGTFATLVAKDDKNYATLKLPSGEVRKVSAQCRATIGVIGNIEHENISLGKAGRSRWLGVRPQTRGMAMNPVDHPMGGGEGKSKSGGGHMHPVTPWGKKTKGLKTRNKRKLSSKLIVQDRRIKK